ncbi:hypothetical protein ABZT51_42105 [Streptomyces sp. NPDC005373]|uniref:hypothetical protein n=1 Tax=Streptomyces sp. NPDC005373 TaxID=3156879 RepID=UPI0033B30B2B
MLDAARKITGLGVGALPIRGSDERFKGVPTDHKVRRLPVIAGHILIGMVARVPAAREGLRSPLSPHRGEPH